MLGEHSPATPKNIVLCFDGTSNEFGTNNTNVIRLVQALDRDTQRLYYDPGVGTLPDPRTIGRIAEKVSEGIDLAFATRLTDKVEAAYTYLMDYWEPGAKVYLFGFSRGAYTARVLAGMLHALGLLSRGNHDLVPYVMHLFGSIPASGDPTGDQKLWDLWNGFRWTFGRQTDNDDRHFKVHFLGVWDTVSSVGWAWEPRSFRFTAHNPSVVNARHAISIDERRAFFRQNQLDLSHLETGQDWKEFWFPGVHCDVGGGYAEDQSGLWLVAFDWMVAEAMGHQLAVDPARLDSVRNHGRPAPAQPWLQPAQESLEGLWKLLEYYPKRHWEASRGYYYRPNLGRPRFIRDGSLIHKSALLRVQAGNYRPRNFSDSFIATVQALSPAPDTFPFKYQALSPLTHLQ